MFDAALKKYVTLNKLSHKGGVVLMGGSEDMQIPLCELKDSFKIEDSIYNRRAAAAPPGRRPAASGGRHAHARPWTAGSLQRACRRRSARHDRFPPRPPGGCPSRDCSSSATQPHPRS